jgi:hypothetical protein
MLYHICVRGVGGTYIHMLPPPILLHAEHVYKFTHMFATQQSEVLVSNATCQNMPHVYCIHLLRHCVLVYTNTTMWSSIASDVTCQMLCLVQSMSLLCVLHAFISVIGIEYCLCLIGPGLMLGCANDLNLTRVIFKRRFSASKTSCSYASAIAYAKQSISQ